MLGGAPPVSSVEPTKRTRDGKPARDSRWRARWRDLDGKSRSQTFDRKTDAEQFLERVGADLQRGEYTDPSLRRVRFGDWADQFWSTSVHVKPSTRRGYRQALEGHLRPAFGARAIGSIDRADVKRWAVDQLERGISPKSVRNWLSVMILVFDEALDAKAIRENPARGVKLPRTRRAETMFFTAEQIETLALAMEPPQYGFLVRFAAYTGLRPGELAGLRVRRLDLRAGRVEVCETLIPVDGRLVAGPTKTYANRTIPLPAFLRKQSAQYLAWLEADQGRLLEPDDYVFRAIKGGPLNRQRFREKVMRPALRRAGLPEQFRAHDLRHTCASLMIGLGAHPKLVMERLGHSDISITMGVYGHVFESLHEHITEQLDELYQRATAPLSVRESNADRASSCDTRATRGTRE
jgi:integrase